ncbi:hypothetical protein DIPPA_07027 [Diplonema papillatum]|nr:hypothetical protein DIPPA_07027 [Diplonema papillatum]
MLAVGLACLAVSAPGGSLTEYVAVPVRVPTGSGDRPMDVLVPKKVGERAISTAAALMDHVLPAWDSVVEHHQEGLVDPKMAHLAQHGLTEHEAWHHYTAIQEGVVDSGRFLLTFSMVPSVQSGGSALFLSAASGDVARLQKLLASPDQDVDEPKLDGMTALHAAATTCQAEVARILLAKGADPNRAAVNGISPLMMAATSGCLPVVSELLSSPDIDVDAKHPFAGSTALHFAAEMGRGAVVSALCKAGASARATKKTGGTALHSAADANRTGAARALVGDCGSDVDALLNGDTTPLYLAAQRGFAEMVTLLAAEGATLDFIMPTGPRSTALATVGGGAVPGQFYAAKNEEAGNGATALHAAAENGHLPAVAALLDAGARQLACMQGATPVLIALQYGHPAIALKLLEAGASMPDAATPHDGSYPLFEAVSRGYRDVVDALLLLRVDVDRKTASGHSPLTVALARGDAELASALLRHGAAAAAGPALLRVAIEGGSKDCVAVILGMSDPATLHTPGVDGLAPVHHAALGGRVGVVELLLRRGADVDGKTAGSKETPLILAADKGFVDVCRLLLAGGAAADQQSGRAAKWRNALHAAAAGGHSRVVALLVEHGARVDYPMLKTRKTALHLAVEHRRLHAAKALVKAGASTRALTADGSTVLHALYTCPARSSYSSEEEELGFLRMFLSDAPAIEQKAKAALEAADQRGDTPLFLALRCRAAPAAVKYLVEALPAAAAFAAPRTGYGAAHAVLAASPPRPDTRALLQYLFDRGASVGRAPVMMAAAAGRAELIPYLLSGGVPRQQRCYHVAACGRRAFEG